VKLAERRVERSVVALCRQPVLRVVAADVFEGRDRDHDVERSILERQAAQVGRHAFEARHLGRGEIDSDQPLGAEPAERCEVRRLGEDVADVEHARLASVAREAPRDLDGALVGARRSNEVPRPLAGCALRCSPGGSVVEQPHAAELGRAGELGDERRPRHAGTEARDGLVELRGLDGAAQHRPPQPADERVVRSRGGVQPGFKRRIQAAQRYAAAVAIEGKRVFVTGGAGFIGTTLARELVERNEVVAFDNLHRDALAATGLADHPNFTLVQGDVLDADAVREAARGATHIVHCAAIAGVDTVLESPVRTMRVNVIGTYNVLEAALATGTTVERFVDFSTSEVFGTHAFRVQEGQVSTIGSVGEARWTYAVSKLAGEHMAHAYHDELGLPTVTVHPFNVYGPGQIGGGAIRAFIETALRGNELTIHGDGSQIRAWCYVTDMVSGVLACLERPEAVGQAFNIGNPRSAVTIYDLAQRIKRLMHYDGEIVFQPLHYADVELRIPNVEKARELLHWEPEVELDDGLQKTIAWYRERLPVSA